MWPMRPWFRRFSIGNNGGRMKWRITASRGPCWISWLPTSGIGFDRSLFPARFRRSGGEYYTIHLAVVCVHRKPDTDFAVTNPAGSLGEPGMNWIRHYQAGPFRLTGLEVVVLLAR